MYIDNHVHCRDFKESYKETIAHALRVAEESGLSAIFDMGANGNPLCINRETVEARLSAGREADSPVFYGVYIGLTADFKQNREAVALYREFFPRPGDRVGVVGLKTFAGKSVGDLSIVKEEDQRGVHQNVTQEDYPGVHAVHCEKEALMRPDLWTPENPWTHSLARPEVSELRSVEDQIDFAYSAGYRGHLHICHVSTYQSVRAVNTAKARGQRVSCGVTPQHLLLDTMNMAGKEGILYKVNPPLREPETRGLVFASFLRGEIDILESDHAPHTFDEKTGRALGKDGKPQYMSGIPGLASWPDIIELLIERGATQELIDNMFYHNVNRIFGTSIPRLNLPVRQGAHLGEYAFDAYKSLKEKRK
jgi:dihydroorotase